MAQTSKETGIQTYGQLQTAYFQQDLRTGQVVYESNALEKQPAASLGKLFIVAAALKAVENDELNLQQRYHITPGEYWANVGGTGKLETEFRPLAILSKVVRRDMLPTKTLKDLLKYSIQFSDNITAAKVADVVGRDLIQDIVDDWGLYDTTILNPSLGTPNETTAQNVGQFLYNFGWGHLVEDKNLVKRFLDWMPTRKATTSNGQVVDIRYKAGNITLGGFSYCHQAGYLQPVDSFIDHAFVVLTRDKAASNKDSTYNQQETVRELVNQEMIYHLG